jgi:alkanesulfonate monooxygenase SsuD/methylene tetrahydromethanopterin reductase-like flavin-dependent oxidoreductase (luciferase family)
MNALTQPGIVGIALDSSLRRYEQAFAVAELADRNGIDVVTSPDHPYLPRELEVWTFLTTVAARTSRVAVGTNVASVALRPARMLAKAASTLHVVSGGRVALGVGAGGPLEQIADFGGPAQSVGESVTAFGEALRVIREDGLTVPLWTGAFAPRTLRLTGRYADGWLPTNLYLDLADVPAMQSRVDDSAREVGRDPAQIRRILNVMGTISEDAERENGRRLSGPPAHWIEALHDYHDRLGFDGFIFWPISGDPLDQAQRFVKEVRPALPALFQPSD